VFKNVLKRSVKRMPVGWGVAQLRGNEDVIEIPIKKEKKKLERAVLVKKEIKTSCWQCGELVSDLREHDKTCAFTTVVCRNPGCTAKVRLEDLEWHQSIGCRLVRLRNVLIEKVRLNRTEEKCFFCMETFESKSRHRQTCIARATPCPLFGCSETVPLVCLKHHMLHDCSSYKNRVTLAERNRLAVSECFPCDKCGIPVTQRTFSKHKSDSCEFRLVHCTGGCEDIEYCRMSDHLDNDCPVTRYRRELLIQQQERQNTIMQCILGCGQSFSKTCLVSHTRTDCPCRFVQCDCGATVKSRDLKLHVSLDLFYTVHKVPRCMFAVRREGLAALSIARERKSELIQCECGLKVSLRDMPQHKIDSCGCRMVVCTYSGCSKTIKAGKLSQHHRVDCVGAALERERQERGERLQTKIDCPNGCGTQIKKVNVKVHCRHECRAKSFRCRLGCGRMVRLDEYDQHIRSDECSAATTRNKLAEKSKLRNQG